MSQDSPCIGICEIDESGYCVGCGRSAVEIYGQTDSPPGRESQPGLGSKFINLLPVRIKYLLPHYVQDFFSVLLRPPLKPEDCTFTKDLFTGTHSFLAVCRKE